MTTAAVQANGPRRRPRDRKQQILVAARDLFAEHGYPSVTMAQIAERVGITAGALYRHFSNKAVMLEEVVNENFAVLHERNSFLDYTMAVDSAIARLADRPYLADFWAHELRYLAPEHAADIRRRMSAYSESFLPALQQRRSDLDPGQQRMVVWAMQSLLSGLGRRALHLPVATRLPIVRAALLALPEARLAPTGPEVVPRQSFLPVVSMRERLLQAAMEQFAQRGYQEATMASIAAMADVTGPNIYGYFASKADLLRAVTERGTHGLWLGLHQIFAEAASPEEAMRLLVVNYSELVGPWAIVLEEPSDEDDVQQARRSVQREYVAEWEALLQQCLPEVDAQTVRVRVQLALFLITDLRRMPSLRRRENFETNLVEVIMTILLDPVAPSA
ncbi:helix-turn-helix domain-containing protein [Nocardioides sp. AE5]|uniref:TetR/AcrR family transcriptional regulator n=1 Tax=Nocardioides sp. AE5 TaxID=2962573 RepID=UPI002881FC6A|nr:helix-turn-helix domain-containing protein [Nocardioides sp. AE5]MDT0200678.1 helix-turn-helix domain-containing protein [Nocardioides sp. AE5]